MRKLLLFLGLVSISDKFDVLQLFINLIIRRMRHELPKWFENQVMKASLKIIFYNLIIRLHHLQKLYNFGPYFEVSLFM